MKTMLPLVAVAMLVGFGLAGGITGQVLDAETGDPIVGAMVVARSEGGASAQARTNERGRYLLDDLRPGKYTVSAAARGYETALFPRPVPVRGDETTEGIDFRLRPMANQNPGAISGQVVCRRTGKPIARARVVAHGQEASRVAHTDGEGNYVIRGLRPGKYRVVAAARHYFKAAFPEPVEVPPEGLVEDINFALVPRPRKGGITGVVVDARTQKPIAGAIVIAHGEHDAGRAVTDRQGRYRMRLRPGKYTVNAAARGYETATFPRPVPVHPREVTRDVDFALVRKALASE